jgi:hypothetical protein
VDPPVEVGELFWILALMRVGRGKEDRKNRARRFFVKEI